MTLEYAEILGPNLLYNLDAFLLGPNLLYNLDVFIFSYTNFDHYVLGKIFHYHIQNMYNRSISHKVLYK